MFKNAIFLIGFMFVCLHVKGHSHESTVGLTSKDSILLEIGTYNTPVFTHHLTKGQTLFSLARFYGLKVYELNYYNQILRNKNYVLQPGDPIVIPLDIKNLVFDSKAQKAVPVYYKIKPKETLYKIAKTYFNIGVDTLMTINHKTNNILSLGETLLVGYIPLEGIERIEKDLKGSPLLQLSFTLKKSYLSLKSEHTEIREQGRGTKLVDDTTDGLYVLHNKAPINSILGIYNPLKKRVIYAKVLGRIPKTDAYYNSILVINNNVSNLLGIKDERFFIKVKHLQNK